jgi:hypothetical protein
MSAHRIFNWCGYLLNDGETCDNNMCYYHKEPPKEVSPEERERRRKALEITEAYEDVVFERVTVH